VKRTGRRIVVYDTTLRDGAQGPGVSFTASDKVRIARRLDALEVEYVEAGWPGSNPKDTEVFDAIRHEPLRHARLAAFGATRRGHITAEEDENLAALLESGAEVCTLVGKASAWQVKEVLRVSRDENLAMIRDSVGYLRSQGREVIFDAEHYFDGYAGDADYALAACLAAASAGASWIVCCDTNGGRLPHEVAAAVGALAEALSQQDGEGRGGAPRIGIHCHNDCDLAVANSLAAVEAGADMVQGTINGLGERCGNANLCSVVPNLRIKLGIDALSESGLSHLTETSQFVAEIANLTPSPQQPFVGEGAFAHKGGQHVAAVMRHQDAYQHIDPALVGNHSRVLVSELAGRGNVLFKAREFGIDVDKDDPITRRLVKHLKDLEHRGYSFEGADASFEMVIRRMRDGYEPPFRLLDFIALVEHRQGSTGGIISEGTIKVRVVDEVLHTAAEGNGPVNALDLALRKALVPRFPQLAHVRLHDYKVRILDEAAGTFAVTRVLIESGDVRDGRRWITVGCSANIIEASWTALADAMEFALLKIPE
jgi:2-isopropylmalate synthase